jgi:hypothetical protein
MKKVFFAITLLLSIPTIASAMQSLHMPSDLDVRSVSYHNNKWIAQTNNGSAPIQPCFVDKAIRNIPQDKLAKLLSMGAYLRLNKLSNDELALHLEGRLQGGGIFGANAGFFAGKFLTHFVGHGTIMVVGLLTGPAAPATITALECTFAPVIEGASNVVGLAGGVAGGVATGPV